LTDIATEYAYSVAYPQSPERLSLRPPVPTGQAMDIRPWKAYLVAISVATGAFFLLPETGWARPIWAVAIGWVGAAAVVAGVRRHRPRGAVAWYLLALGVFLNATGIGVEATVRAVTGGLPAPSLADVFYLGLYPGLVAGLVLLIHRRTAGRDWASLVDALTVSTGLGLLMWVFIIRPSVGDPSVSAIGQFVSILYPIGDIVVLAMVVRLLIGGGRRTPAYWILAGTVLVFLTADVTWATLNQLGLEPGPHAASMLQMLYLAGYAMFGLAALHPSVRDVGDQGSAQRSRVSPALLAVLSVVCLIAPGILVLEVIGQQISDGIAIATGSAALFLLVVLRMAQLLRQVEKQSRRLQELTHVDELTGLPNRRAWAVELPRAIERARRDGRPLAVAMLDLDHFKRFNDEYGHPAGDRMLKSAGAAWRAQARTVDQLARYGGEEFILLLPNADSQAAAVVVDRLLRATPLGQTFSAGIAVWNGTETSDDLVARADRALYRAKAEGRNRIAAADPHLVPVAAAAQLAGAGFDATYDAS
jgi:diguanylate cyclase (GGDEF)-like protein